MTTEREKALEPPKYVCQEGDYGEPWRTCGRCGRPSSEHPRSIVGFCPDSFASAAPAPEAPPQAETTEARDETLEIARAYGKGYAAGYAAARLDPPAPASPGTTPGEPEQAYGAFPGGDPRNFTPDPECSTEVEREAHRRACALWDAGANAFSADSPAHQWVVTDTPDGQLVMHVARGKFGLGTYTRPAPAPSEPRSDQQAREIAAKLIEDESRAAANSIPDLAIALADIAAEVRRGPAPASPVPPTAAGEEKDAAERLLDTLRDLHASPRVIAAAEEVVAQRRKDRAP